VWVSTPRRVYHKQFDQIWSKGAKLGRAVTRSCGFYLRDQVNVAVASQKSESSPVQNVLLEKSHMS
jgi:hypothetical protein